MDTSEGNEICERCEHWDAAKVRVSDSRSDPFHQPGLVLAPCAIDNMETPWDFGCNNFQAENEQHVKS